MAVEHKLDPFFGRHYISSHGNGEESFADLYALYWFTVLIGVIWLPAVINEIRNGKAD